MNKILISNVNHNDYDAVVVVGGAGSPVYLWDNTDLHKLIVNMNKSGKVTAAICLSGVVLARAGILKGVDATVYRTEDSMNEYIKSDVYYVSKSVVESGKIITADGPSAARDFGYAVVNAV